VALDSPGNRELSSVFWREKGKKKYDRLYRLQKNKKEKKSEAHAVIVFRTSKKEERVQLRSYYARMLEKKRASYYSAVKKKSVRDTPIL